MMKESTTILKPLKRISPSRYTSISKCPYRVVLANSYSFPLLPYPPANHLGNIIHECIRLFITGKTGTNTEFDEMWNRLLAKEEKALKDMGFGFFTPLNQNIPGYTIKKLQLKSQLERQNKVETQRDRKTDISILAEQWLEAQDALIAGYADMIINLNGYTKLSDFKSGQILLEEGGVKEEYENQLKLYAYLYNETFGKYPDELSIIDLENKEYSITFTVQECEKLAGRAREALFEINNLIKNDKLEKLAKPDPENCQSCLYRPACNFYWSFSLPETDSVFRDIKGILTKVRQFRNGNLNITLESDGKEVTVSQITNEHLPLLTDLIGKQVAFYNVKKEETTGSYRSLRTTKIYEA